MKPALLIPLSFASAAIAFGQQPEQDIVEEVREASEPMTPIEKRLVQPKAFDPILPSKDPYLAKFLDPAWDITQLYFDERNEVIQEVALTGLLHLRTAGSQSVPTPGTPTSGDVDSGLRRARLGARLKAFYNTTVEADLEMRDSDYEGINDLKVTNHFNSQTWVSFGKMKAPFSKEWATHSSDLKVYDRSPLVAQLHPRRSIGFLVEGQITDTWGYQVGLYSGADSRHLGSLSDPFWFLGLNYNFAKQAMPDLESQLAKAGDKGLPEQLNHAERWYLHYIYNLNPAETTAIGSDRVAAGASSVNTGNTIGRDTLQYRHMLATGFEFQQDHFSLDTELLWAGGSNGTVWGLSVTPSYWISPGQLELVARWAYAASDNTEGVLLNADPSRDFLYSNTRFYTGNSMHSFYLGGNYYPYADQFNIQGGVDYTQLDGPNGVGIDSWTYFIGSRLKF